MNTITVKIVEKVVYTNKYSSSIVGTRPAVLIRDKEGGLYLLYLNSLTGDVEYFDEILDYEEPYHWAVDSDMEDIGGYERMVGKTFSQVWE